MRDPDEFDAFYRDAGERLLLQTYALTGDLSAARGAVRDSFIVAWHHWRKVSRLEDPESFVRPHAWRHAQRRHTARLGFRDRSVTPEVRATLDALAKLSVPQRKALLLTQLAAVSMPEMAREVGLPLEDAERELQTAASQFALVREIAAADIPLQFEALAQVVAEVRFPRAPIVRRAGAARRRTHTTVGVVGAVAAFLLTGSLITDATGVRPSLDFEQVTAAEPGRTMDPAPEIVLTEDTLLSADQVSATMPGRAWTVRRTGDSSEGSGLLTRCQQERYADPRGTAALVRTFGAAPRKDRPKATVLQLTEASTTPRAARRSYRTALAWYAACAAERVQLLSTRRVDGVGDQAMLVVLRAWGEPVETMTVGIARTGEFVTTTMSVVRNTQQPDARRAARLLADAVSGLCTLPDAGACAGRPQLTAVPPMPTGEAPAMLSELDLPPVTGVDKPWIGPPPARATTNPAATRCDGAEFSGRFEGKPFSNNLTRTFVILKAGLPDRFGLTETVGSLPRKRAVAFVERIRNRLATCAEKDLGTDVTRVAHRDGKDVDVTVWQLTTEISDNESVSYAMAVLRDGTSVAQVGFVPSEDARMADGAFVDLVFRALDRLGRLPRPAKG
jgi:DNA-directed RNA polymerase specialized sigma24 family protein